MAALRAEAIEEGLEQGREEGLEEGLHRGLEKGKLEIACNLLAEGASLEFVQKITGLDMETIKNLQR
jgi:predicted transposase/invertase (TIGR01784 family)